MVVRLFIPIIVADATIAWYQRETQSAEFFVSFQYNDSELVIVRSTGNLSPTLRHSTELAWTGGPIHLDSEYGVDLFTIKGQHIKDNVIAVKAVSFKDDIYVLTPRLKPGVLATIWLTTRTSKGVQLDPYPDLKAHSLTDCDALQNAVDFFLDHFGNLWVLDTGIIETQYNPRCTCPPKVMTINLLVGKVTRHIDLSAIVESTSLLQSIVVEHVIEGKNFIYVSDTSRGAILVYDVSANTGWTVLACLPAAGLQMVITKKGLAHSVLVLVRVQYPGLIELDTAALRRGESVSPLRVFNEHAIPVLLLGSSPHLVFLRLAGSTDVLSWDSRDAFNSSKLEHVHSPGPTLLPTSVTVDPLLHSTLILDSNYPETVLNHYPTYHRITFIDILFC